MRLLFCADPLQSRCIDDAYREEFDAAASLALDRSLISFEALVFEGDAAAAVRRVPAADTPTTGVYRGWMLTIEQYRQLFEALQGRQITLLNTPEQYAYCHYLPLSYPQIAEFTPKTIWIPKDNFAILDLPVLLESFGTGPIIVKDYVKSRKHEWAEACFISSAADTDTARRVVETFIKRQGSDLSGGLVFREFVEFEPLALHSKSAMPLSREFRLVFLDGKVLSVSRYWKEGDYAGEQPPLDRLTAIARTIPSRFFTMDAARTREGDWMIVELGDAQVAELPPETRPHNFFVALAAQA